MISCACIISGEVAFRSASTSASIAPADAVSTGSVWVSVAIVSLLSFRA